VGDRRERGGDAAGYPVLAQSPAKAHVAVPVIAARPEDVSSIEAIVKADYESISGGVGVPASGHVISLSTIPTRDRSSVHGPEDPCRGHLDPSAQEYTDAVDAQFVKAGSANTKSRTRSSLRQHRNVFSSYEGMLASSAKLVSQGVNVYQLYFDGKRWWISSVSWDGNLDPSLIPADMRGH